MNLRRDRTHHSGSTNLNYASLTLLLSPSNPFYRSKTMTPQDNKSKTHGVFFSSLSKGKKVSDVLEKRISRNILSPIDKVQELYKSTGRFVRSKTQVGYPRMEQLEEHEKRKLVFTGESVLLYDRFLEKYRDQEVSIDKIDHEPESKHLLFHPS